MKKLAKAIIINECDSRDEAFTLADSMREVEPEVEFRVIPFYNSRFAVFAGSRAAIREYLR